MAVDTAIPAAPSRANLIWLVAILSLAVLLSGLGFSYSPNTPIAFRYAAQFRVGHGLVFNPGEPVLLIPSPAYLLMLGIAAAVFPSAPVHGIAWLLSAIALTVGANSLYRIAKRTDLSDVSARWVSVLYIIMASLSAGGEFAVAAALSIAALDLALSSRWQQAGIIFAIAVLCRPEALLLAILILFLLTNTKARWQYVFALILTLLLAVVGLRLYYGVLLWDGLLTLKPEVAPFNVLSVLHLLPLGVLAIWGWYRQKNDPVAALCGALVVLYVVIFTIVLQVSGNHIDSQLVAPLSLLAVVGAHKLKVPPIATYLFMLAVPLYIALTLGPQICFGCYTPDHQYIEFTSEDVKDSKSVGAPSIDAVLALQSSPQQFWLALDGQLQPDVKRLIERADYRSLLIRYAPETLIVYNSPPQDRFSASAWTQLDYRPANKEYMFRRNALIGTFVDQPANIPYGPDMRLVGLALDQSSLRPGQLLRVRLDWELARPADRPVTVDLQLTADNKSLAQARDEFAPSVFQAGRWSTYHTITLADDAQPGSLALNVAVIVNDGTVARVPVATLSATPR
ncbi:MAG: hypothetical protein IT324_07295 [Anaerolineae bacterium]|nr:hypothetical protein [Anaerolineae bacterium]